MADEFATITIEGMDASTQTVTAIQGFASDIGTTVEKAARIVEDKIRQTFRDLRDPWGNAWPPLSPVTIAQRQAHNSFNIQPLVDKGTMFDSLQTIRQGDNSSVTIGGPGMFPDVQQFGNPENKAWGRGHAPIPARAFFPLREGGGADIPEAWIADVLLPIERELQGAAGK
jgi:phage gpG-like protein